MCEACSKATRGLQQRSKLGDIDDTYHCSVVGTCLSLHDLDKLAKKSSLMFPTGAVPYQKHGAFVKAISETPSLAKFTGKYLDRKYSSAIRRSKQLRCKVDLALYWSDALKAGDVPGPFWASFTHPLADSEFSTQLFGDIHMLSHLVGASNRADIKMLGKLESERDRYRALFEKTKDRMRRAVKQKTSIISRQEDDLALVQRDQAELERLRAKISDIETGTKEISESKRLDELEELLAATVQQNTDLVQQSKIEQPLNSENEALRAELMLLQKEHDALETLTWQNLGEFCDTCELNSMPKTPIDLEGATIVYVGGRTGHIGNFKALVKAANGEFLHHDGGMEDSDHRLAQLMSGCDIVMCPMDCVSHQASIRAKKFCKHAGKKFVPLRSSGLSTFVASLQEFSH